MRLPAGVAPPELGRHVGEALGHAGAAGAGALVLRGHARFHQVARAQVAGRARELKPPMRCLQMLHQPLPLSIVVLECPDGVTCKGRNTKPHLPR